MAADDFQQKVDYLRNQGLSDSEIMQVLNGGSVTKQPTQPTQSSNPLSSLTSLAPKFMGAGGLGGSAPATPDVISANFVNGGATNAAGAGGFGFADALPIAAIPLGAMAAYQGFKDKSPGKAAFGGAVSGAGLGFEIGGPLGAGIGAGAGGLLGLGSSLFNHKSTKKYEQEGTNSALSLSPDDPKWKDFVMKARASAHSDLYPDVQIGVNPPAHEGVTADDRMFSLGNLQTFGPDWMNKYNVDQERNISQALLDNDLYSSSKGDVHVTNQDLAKQLAQQVIAGTYKYKSGSAPVAPDYAATQAPPKTTGMSNLAPLAVSQTDPSLIAKSIADEQIAAQAQAQNMQSASDKKTRLMGMANLSSIAPLPIARLDTSNLLKNKYA